MRVLLEFCLNSWIFVYCFLSFLWVLLECGSYSRAGLFQGFTVVFLVRLSVTVLLNELSKSGLCFKGNYLLCD